MNLKRLIPLYQVGQIVNIIQINTNKRYLAGATSEMFIYSHRNVTISRVVGGNMYRILEDGEIYNWSYDLFQESYEQEETIPEIKIGTYLLFKDDKELLFEIIDIGEFKILTTYVNKVHLNNPNLDAFKIRYKFDYTKDDNNKFSFSNKSLYYPTNEELKCFGVSNDNNIVEINNTLPNLFDYSKYPIVNLKFLTRKTNNSEFKHHDEVVFKITKDILVTYKNDKYITYKNCEIQRLNSFDDKIRKNIIKQWGKVTIKDYINSSNLFGHIIRKKKMNELVNNKKQIFTISNIIFDYEKNEKKYNVIEVFDGTLNLKFLMDDINLILPNVNNYNIPKDRTIKKLTQCKIINNKLLPVSKNTKVKVMQLFNRHTPINNKTFDKNTIALVMENKINGKSFECKIKQLKLI